MKKLDKEELGDYKSFLKNMGNKFETLKEMFTDDQKNTLIELFKKATAVINEVNNSLTKVETEKEI